MTSALTAIDLSSVAVGGRSFFQPMLAAAAGG
jgi:hypothetical protein